MTVQRSDIEIYDLSKSKVAVHIEAVLSEHPEYRSSQGAENGKFEVSVKPGALLLPTPMTIKLEECEGKTAVRVKTKSQRFIMGDVLGYYDRYIREFLV